MRGWAATATEAWPTATACSASVVAVAAATAAAAIVAAAAFAGRWTPEIGSGRSA